MVTNMVSAGTILHCYIGGISYECVLANIVAIFTQYWLKIVQHILPILVQYLWPILTQCWPKILANIVVV